MDQVKLRLHELEEAAGEDATTLKAIQEKHARENALSKALREKLTSQLTNERQVIHNVEGGGSCIVHL